MIGGYVKQDGIKKTAITKVFAAFIGMVEKNNKKTYNTKHQYFLHYNSSINWIKLQLSKCIKIDWEKEKTYKKSIKEKDE